MKETNVLSNERNRTELLNCIERFVPFNEQEACDKALLQKYLQSGGMEIFTRKNTLAHLTSSAWVVNESRTKVLMIYHNIYNSWSWLGGHADGDCDLKAVALREVHEESGLSNLRCVSDGIYSLEMLTVDGHEKRGEYVSSHIHLNVTYLIQADENEPLRIKADENSGVKWFELNDAIEASSEPWFKTRIYSKLNKKLALIIKQ